MNCNLTPWQFLRLLELLIIVLPELLINITISNMSMNKKCWRIYKTEYPKNVHLQYNCKVWMPKTSLLKRSLVQMERSLRPKSGIENGPHPLSTKIKSRVVMINASEQSPEPQLTFCPKHFWAFLDIGHANPRAVKPQMKISNRCYL